MYIDSNLCYVTIDVTNKDSYGIDLIIEFVNHGEDLNVKNTFIILIGSTTELHVISNFMLKIKHGTSETTLHIQQNILNGIVDMIQLVFTAKTGDIMSNTVYI